MTSEEKSRLLMLQQRMCDEAVLRAQSAEAQNTELNAKIGELLSIQRKMQADLSSLVSLLAEKDRLVDELRKMVADKEGELALRNRQTFGHKSQKGGRKKHHDDEPPHDRCKEDFDGTPESVNIDSPGENAQEDRPQECRETPMPGR